MSEITTDMLITNILNGMYKSLDDEQFQQLKNILHIQLHDVEVTNKCYDLVKALEDNDTVKIQHFVASSRIRKLSEDTINQYVNTVIKMRTFVGKNFVDIQTTDIEFYLAHNSMERHWKTTTLLNNIHNLNAFFVFLQKKEIIAKNPMDRIDPVKEEKTIKASFSPTELEQLKLACNNDYRDMALIEFLLATGVRVGDLLKLKWGGLDFTHLEFIAKKGKGNKDRYVPFSEKCGFYLLRYLDFRMDKENRTKAEMMCRPLFVRRRRDPITKDYECLSKRGVEDILKRIGAKVSILDIYPHKFRRTFATDAINKGMAIEILMKILGHEQYDTTLGYANIKTNKIEQAYRTICE